MATAIIVISPKEAEATWDHKDEDVFGNFEKVVAESRRT